MVSHKNPMRPVSDPKYRMLAGLHFRYGYRLDNPDVRMPWYTAAQISCTAFAFPTVMERTGWEISAQDERLAPPVLCSISARILIGLWAFF